MDHSSRVIIDAHSSSINSSLTQHISPQRPHCSSASQSSAIMARGQTKVVQRAKTTAGRGLFQTLQPELLLLVFEALLNAGTSNSNIFASLSLVCRIWSPLARQF